MANNTCVCCGQIIPEGRQICPQCEDMDVPKYDPTQFFSAERQKKTGGRMRDLIRRDDAILAALNYDGDGNGQDASMDIAGSIGDIPAVDAVEVKHGRWKREEVNPAAIRFRCSECGEVSVLGVENYCWSCGAKMDGEDGDGDG